nr:GNVR domain-containing protein [Clostridium cibarium]
MTKDLIDNALESKNIDENTKIVQKELSVTPKADTQLLEVSYLSSDKYEATDIVLAVTNEFVKYSKELIPNVNVIIVEKAVLPDKPVSPNKPLYIFIAFIIGALVGIIISITLEFYDNTFRDRVEVEEKLDIPVLGNIPCIN